MTDEKEVESPDATDEYSLGGGGSRPYGLPHPPVAVIATPARPAARPCRSSGSGGGCLSATRRHRKAGAVGRRM